MFLVSCTGIVEKSPARISLEGYLKSLKNSDYDSAYEYYSDENKANCPKNEFKKNADDVQEMMDHSRLIFKNEKKVGEKIKINFLIQFDDTEMDLFDNAIVDPYLDSETVQLIFENSEWKIDNLIWPIDWCDRGENNR
mgnify:CR=1 FL=1|tara:strand:- start:1881 stop:2294 length:414 start_codon:yes stop_codon:yes gene_type:complete